MIWWLCFVCVSMLAVCVFVVCFIDCAFVFVWLFVHVLCLSVVDCGIWFCLVVGVCCDYCLMLFACFIACFGWDCLCIICLMFCCGNNLFGIMWWFFVVLLLWICIWFAEWFAVRFGLFVCVYVGCSFVFVTCIVWLFSVYRGLLLCVCLLFCGLEIWLVCRLFACYFLLDWTSLLVVFIACLHAWIVLFMFE